MFNKNHLMTCLFDGRTHQSASKGHDVLSIAISFISVRMITFQAEKKVKNKKKNQETFLAYAAPLDFTKE